MRPLIIIITLVVILSIHLFPWEIPKYSEKHQKSLVWQERAVGVVTRSVDAIVFTKDRPLRLLALLESYHMHCRNAGGVAVVVSASSVVIRSAYHRIEELFPGVLFVFESDTEGFKDATLFALEGLKSPYVAVLVDEIVVVQDVDLSLVAAFMDTYAPDGTFQLRLGTLYSNFKFLPLNNILEPSKINIHGTLHCYGWSNELEKVQPTFYHFINVDAGVYSSQTVKKDWSAFNFKHPGELEFGWYGAKFRYPKGCVHLFFDKATAVNIESGGHVRDDSPIKTKTSFLEKDAVKLLRGSRYNVASLSGTNVSTSHMAIPMLLND